MKLEVNGQIVEVDDSFEKLSAEEQNRTVDEIAASIGASTKSAPSTGELTAELAAPAITAAGMGPLGINTQAIADVARPIIETAKETYRGPMGVVRGVADATLMAHGIPPLAGPYTAAESITSRAQAINQALGEASKGLSQTPMTTAASGAQYPSGVPDYRTMQKAAPEVAGRLTELYKSGGPNAVRAFLQSPEAATYLNNPAFREAAESYASKVPGVMAQAGKIAAPVAKMAAGVLGPAGMAYDLYQAGQVARDTQLGERLAQGQGQRAQQAFRGGLGMTYQGPQLNPQEAQNVLQSGSARDIQYFGGRDRLTEMIRRKAAEKVLGPIAPGTF